MKTQDERIVDPGVAAMIAWREEYRRQRTAYWWGSMLAGAAMGDPYYAGMLRVSAEVAAKILPAPAASSPPSDEPGK